MPGNGVAVAFVPFVVGAGDGVTVGPLAGLKTSNDPLLVPVTRRPSAMAGDAHVSPPRS